MLSMKTGINTESMCVSPRGPKVNTRQEMQHNTLQAFQKTTGDITLCLIYSIIAAKCKMVQQLG